MLILLFVAFGLPVLLISADNFLHKKILHRERDPSKQFGIFLWGLVLGGVLGMYIVFGVIEPRLPKETKTNTSILDCIYDCANSYGNYYVLIEEDGTKIIKILGSQISVIKDDVSKIVYIDETEMPIIREERVCFRDDGWKVMLLLDSGCREPFFTIFVPEDRVIRQ